MKVVTSMPSFLESFGEDVGPSSPAFRRQTVVELVQDQLVELRPLPMNGGSVVVQENETNVAVVFKHKRDDLASEFWLQATDQPDLHTSWSMPFCRTKLPPGMYMFYFLVDGVRALSSMYPVVGDLNVAIFSDALRRYIIGRARGIPDQGACELPQ